MKSGTDRAEQLPAATATVYEFSPAIIAPPMPGATPQERVAGAVQGLSYDKLVERETGGTRSTSGYRKDEYTSAAKTCSTCGW
ncbi:MAG: hypothetical protein KF744_07840 [Taibaiella sp.]|nr:hypothetical protein [Taibaiella sp.]